MISYTELLEKKIINNISSQEFEEIKNEYSEILEEELKKSKCQAFTSSCQNCDKVRRTLIKIEEKVQSFYEICYIYKNKKLWKDYPNFLLNNFKFVPSNKNLQIVLDNFKQNNSKNFFIFGPTGVGKTHFAVGLAKFLTINKQENIFVNILEIAEAMRKYFAEETDVYIFDTLKEIKIVFIDDFGAEKENEFLKERLLDLLDFRLRVAKSTVILSNLDLEKIKERYGDRIYSRVSMMEKIQIQEYDRRVFGEI